MARPAPELRNPDAKGRKLATEFVTIVQDRDIDELGAFLDPAFQIQRADGSGGNRKEYLARPTTIDTFELGPTVHAVQDGDLLTVRWSLKISETIKNEQYSEAEAPRLSVFRWDGRRWRLAAHANFNVPA